jgi:cardiolipin synthase C
LPFDLMVCVNRFASYTLCLLVTVLTGCAGLPSVPEQAHSRAEHSSADTLLGRFALQAGLPPGDSGIQSMPQAEYALAARIELIRRAQRSIDLQTYQIGHDGVGRAILKELRDAARRGVRVRLLVDDFYTLGLDRPLLHLAAHDRVQVRLYNPFVYGRDSGGGRFWNLLSDGRRLNHRMHNKMLVIDGAVAIVGGRNLTDEYFMRSKEGNFLDIDFLFAGAVVPELGSLFDRYWNHPRVIEIQRVSDDGLSPEQRRAAFDAFAALAAAHEPLSEPDMLGAPPLGQALERGLPNFRVARARAFADDPAKTLDSTSPRDRAQPNSTLAWIESQIGQRRSETLLVSPYFLPDERTRRRLSAEALVAFASHRHRDGLLAAGIRLFEVHPAPSVRTPLTRLAPDGAKLRLHAKMGIFDRRVLGIGSINLDPRSHRINTELAILIDSYDLASDMGDALRSWMQTDGVQEVARSQNGLSFRIRKGEEVIETDEEPGLGWWTRLRLRLVYLLVPDELL